MFPWDIKHGCANNGEIVWTYEEYTLPKILIALDPCIVNNSCLFINLQFEHSDGNMLSGSNYVLFGLCILYK